MKTITAAEVAEVVAELAHEVDAYGATAEKLNAMGVALEGSTDPTAPWTDDDVAQCVEAHLDSGS